MGASVKRQGYDARQYTGLYNRLVVGAEQSKQRGARWAIPEHIGQQIGMEEWAKQLEAEREAAEHRREIMEDLLKHDRVLVYRTKRIKAGRHLYMHTYPVYVHREDAVRAKRMRETGQTQARYNARRSAEWLVCLVQENFGSNDIWITLTYPGAQPPSEEQARKDIKNYIKRVNRWREKRGMGKARYVYVIEWEDDGEAKRVHHHVIMSGMDRETAETIWGAGRTNAAKLQPDDAGLEALARYITKGTGRAKHSKRWGASKGLKKPKITTADKKISKRQMARMAAGGEDAAREAMARIETGYDLKEITIKRSDYMPGAYMYAMLQRRGDAKEAKRYDKMDHAGGIQGPDGRGGHDRGRDKKACKRTKQSQKRGNPGGHDPGGLRGLPRDGQGTD